MKFNHKKLAPGVLRPIIPIAVGHNDFFVSYEVLVDSGADMCIFDAEIGELLGIEYRKRRKERNAEHYRRAVRGVLCSSGGDESRWPAVLSRGRLSWGTLGAL